MGPGGASDLSPGAQRALPGLGRGAPEQTGAAVALEVPVEADWPGSYPLPQGPLARPIFLVGSRTRW